MSAKIERIANFQSVIQSAVKRRESEGDGSSDEKSREKRDEPEQDDAEKKAVDRPTVEKAMSDLTTSSGFSETGMKVEVFEGADGLRVRLAYATGAVVKVMTAEEFMKLRENSEDGEVPRGKILDQKY